jgi:hypothetical protein
LKIKPDAPPGVYDVEVGVYDPHNNLERLRVLTEDGRITEKLYALGKVRCGERPSIPVAQIRGALGLIKRSSFCTSQ